MTRLKRETDLLYDSLQPGFSLLHIFLVETPLRVPDGTQSLAGFHNQVLFIGVIVIGAGSTCTDTRSHDRSSQIAFVLTCELKGTRGGEVSGIKKFWLSIFPPEVTLRKEPYLLILPFLARVYCV